MQGHGAESCKRAPPPSNAASIFYSLLDQASFRTDTPTRGRGPPGLLSSPMDFRGGMDSQTFLRPAEREIFVENTMHFPFCSLFLGPQSTSWYSPLPSWYPDPGGWIGVSRTPLRSFQKEPDLDAGVELARTRITHLLGQQFRRSIERRLCAALSCMDTGVRASSIPTFL